jgi:hypothetical protein
MQGRIIMFHRSSIGAFVLAAALTSTTGGARAADDVKYPNWKGQWQIVLARNVGGQNIRFDPTKAWERPSRPR